MKKNKKVMAEELSVELLKTWNCSQHDNGKASEKTKRFLFENTDDMIDFGQNIFTYPHNDKILIETMYELNGKIVCAEVKVNSVKNADDLWLLKAIEEEYVKIHG